MKRYAVITLPVKARRQAQSLEDKENSYILFPQPSFPKGTTHPRSSILWALIALKFKK